MNSDVSDRKTLFKTADTPETPPTSYCVPTTDGVYDLHTDNLFVEDQTLAFIPHETGVRGDSLPNDYRSGGDCAVDLMDAGDHVIELFDYYDWSGNRQFGQGISAIGKDGSLHERYVVAPLLG